MECHVGAGANKSLAHVTVAYKKLQAVISDGDRMGSLGCCVQYLGLDKCTFRTDARGNQAVGITWPASPYEAGTKWSPLLRHMLAEQQLVGRDVQEDDLLCFDRLLLGRSQALDWCAPLNALDPRPCTCWQSRSWRRRAEGRSALLCPPAAGLGCSQACNWWVPSKERKRVTSSV